MVNWDNLKSNEKFGIFVYDYEHKIIYSQICKFEEIQQKITDILTDKDTLEYIHTIIIKSQSKRLKFNRSRK